jgi:hypothetical protein
MHRVLLLAAMSLALVSCEKTLEAPTDRGVCWHMAVKPDGTPRFNVLARAQPDIEHCAGQLDIMRLRFMGLGSQQQDVVGAYQGQFLFAGPQGVSIAQSFKGYRWLLMVHSGDGRLVKPGAMPSE